MSINKSILKKLSGLKLYCIKIITKLKKLLSPVKNNHHLYALTPINEKNDDTYFKSLKWALRKSKKNQIRNIALTGIYGSGKSSIIRSFEKKFFRRNPFIYISLANFSDTEKNSKLNPLVEKSILQQLFYTVKQTKIPLSRFRRIPNNASNRRFVGFILLCIIDLIFAYHILFSSSIFNFSITTNSLLWFRLFIILPYIIFFILSYFLISKTTLFVRSRLRISKVGFKNMDFEVGANSNESIFNKYLDEIIYLFENTKYDTVVIEDLDRFENTDIFTKLREINTLINNSQDISKPVWFIYAIKDDIFEEENKDNRTKFFDLIVPVVPYVSASNSLGELNKMLKNNGLNNTFQREFLAGISIYIPNMRMLQNIVNEFILYKDKLADLEKTSGNLTKLFSMIIYKNLFPQDFDKLQKRQGTLYTIFSEKHRYIKNEITRLENYKEKLFSQKEIYENEQLNDVTELTAAFWYYIDRKYNGFISATINDSNKQVLDRNNLQGFSSQIEHLKNFKELTIRTRSNPYPKLSAATINSEFGKGTTIYNRFKTASETKEKRISIVNEQIRKSDSEINELKEMSLCEFICKYNCITYSNIEYNIYLNPDNAILKTIYDKQKNDRLRKESEKNNQTLKTNNQIIVSKPIFFLLENGHIDESYENFITYFRSGRYKRCDFQFIHCVRNGEAKEFDYRLEVIEEVLLDLYDKDFLKPEILNFTLLNYLLKSKDTRFSEKKHYLLENIINLSEISCRFINKYKNSEFYNDYWSIFQKKLCSLDSFANFIDKYKGKCEQQEYYEFFKGILYNSNINDLSMHSDNKPKVISSVLEDPLGVITIFNSEDDLDKLLAILQLFQIKYSEIDVQSLDSSIVELLFNNNCYKVNKHNLLEVVPHFADKENIKISTDNEIYSYTNILNTNSENLISYINENIFDYISEIYKESSEMSESEFAIIELITYLDSLDDNESTDRIANSIIGKVKFRVAEITAIEKKHWECLIEYNRILISWNNLNEYFKEYGLDGLLVNLINEQDISSLKTISINNLDHDESIDSIFNLIKQIRLDDNIEEEKVKIILSDYNRVIADIKLFNFSQNRIETLIECDDIQFNTENFTVINSNHSTLIKSFILTNIKDYISDYDSFDLVTNQVLSSILREDIDIKLKLELISKLSDDQLDTLSNEIISILQITNRKTSPNIFTRVMTHHILDESSAEKQAALLLKYYDDLSSNQIIAILENMNGKYPSCVITRSKPSFHSSTTNKNLFNKLKEDNIIKDVTPTTTVKYGKTLTVRAHWE